MYRPLLQLVYWVISVAFILGTGFLPMMDNITHTSGFIMGIFSGMIIVPDMRNNKNKKQMILMRTIGCICVGLLFLTAFYILIQGIDIRCAPVCCWFLLSVSC